VTSRDLHLTGEQQHASQAVDMVIAQRTKVFTETGCVTFFFSFPWVTPAAN
jgi:hypothetical protein